MRLITSCFFSALLSIGLATAQEKPLPLAKQSFKPTGIRIGTDLIDVVKTFSGPTFKGWEVNGDVDFRNYYFTMDVGSWAKNVTLTNGVATNGAYNNSGEYLRLGVDINLLGEDPDKNMFFFGFRYGRSLFHENLTYTATSPNLFLPVTISQSNDRVSGGWAELTTGLRVKVWRELWMGYTARLKFAPTTAGNLPTLAPYDMPGYGIIGRAPWWGFNYQVFWRFVWKKDKSQLKK